MTHVHRYLSPSPAGHEAGDPDRCACGAVRPERFGDMQVIATDQGAGRRYRCPCGWEGWSTWGHAARHAAACPRSGKLAKP